MKIENKNKFNNKESNEESNEENLQTKGGRVIASGGFGCVFSPALKCEDSTKREKNKISKLMTEKYAVQEYEEIIKIKERLENIPNYQNYFLLKDFTICKPAKLDKEDIKEFKKTCTALPKFDINEKNINKSLDKLMLLNMPNGGVPIDDYIFNNGSFEKLININNSLIELLLNGIIPMNDLNVYHADIKDSNILVKENEDLKTRLIDWGLSTEYIPFKDNPFPKTWRNRPLQFNVPFSVIIFSDIFIEQYTKYLKNGGKTDALNLKPFVLDYLYLWLKERGKGHYNFINNIMTILFIHNFKNIKDIKIKEYLIENEFTINYITNYIVEVLIYFTKFRKNGSLNLREYLDNVFIRIVDIWGFIISYFPILELLYDNYDVLTPNQLLIFETFKKLFIKYLYNPRIKPINTTDLVEDLHNLGNLFENEIKKKNIASGLERNSFSKTRKKVKKIIHRKSRLIFKVPKTRTRKNRKRKSLILLRNKIKKHKLK